MRSEGVGAGVGAGTGTGVGVGAKGAGAECLSTRTRVVLLLAHGLEADYPLLTTCLRQEVRAVWVDLQRLVARGDSGVGEVGGVGAGSGVGGGAGTVAKGAGARGGWSEELRAVQRALSVMGFEV